MREERRTILALIALGRLTPAEAERLIAASDRGHEDNLILAACAAVLILQSQGHILASVLIHAQHIANPSSLAGLSHALTGIAHLLGGLL